MKRCIIILSLFILFKPILPWVEYAFFYDYIKNELCINKENKTSSCHGKCHLTKQLAKASDIEGKDKHQLFPGQKEIVICQEISNYFLEKILLQKVKGSDYSYQETYTYNFNHSLFRPPIA